ncbi:exopolysaccharide biosynthesis polyprenyl glycosylphosphotransferase [Leptospira idonii]|uniref:Exopolysaccharide biosynthesis polyprenyl glycosylphosphotransferase n=1 Tax=Leptospira idonii TaxID=1193500 RepID=A0A4R9LXK0_9LEPT|nr:exopolysaccharide biosynthesis polyprenyl glycosylphosphotransferase [Leptospira idonii]TGN18291.1 exopolysaccharide biosynthesis polyprenyl glycosylphosphotransferase [Leptospira idonii]
MEVKEYTRRHSRWFERILLSYSFQFLSGGFVLILCTAVPIWGWRFWDSEDPNIITSLVACLLSFLISTISLRNLFRLPGSETVAYILPVTTICFAIPIGLILVFRATYSIQVFVVGFCISLLWCYIGYFLGRRYRLVRYALLPFGEPKEFEHTHGALFQVIEKPDLESQRFNAIVADLNSSEMTPSWEKFLAACTLSRIPVYSTKKIREAVLGRVKIDHLSENEFGSLLPSSFYEITKRCFDFLGALILIPLLLPFFILISLIIRLESKGNAFFVQERMGYRGRIFKMIKFRSMYTELRGSGFTNEKEDPRITKFGKILRKYRIDELPQIFNIFLGQMSFIGPRPESYELSQWYERDVPFFAYRHIVRPGITGWAQVEQGYAAEVDGMKIKLQYDFYYIKNFSFWLDLLIVFKTVKTILTGFGAR